MKNYTHFRKIERLELSILLKKGYAQKDIGVSLCKSPSSVTREIKRNSVNGEYDPQKAHHKAYVKRKYSKYQGMKVRENAMLEEYVKRTMKRYWSPEQIAGTLKLYYGKNIISHMAIYKYVYSIHGRRLITYLAYGHVRKKKQRQKREKWRIIKDRVFIDQRPEIINQRLRFGDFEGDTLGVPRTSQETLAGLVERKSRYFLAQKTKLKYTMERFKELLPPAPFGNSLTLDGGGENARYQELGIQTFFCHPYSSWEKGSIENSFQRLRRFIPKKSNIQDYSQKEITAIVSIMNNTPRKCLGYRTSKEVFDEEYLTNSNPEKLHLRV